MTMYYDEKLKRWVDPAAPESSEATVAGPPPTGAQSPAPAPAPAPSGSGEADRSEPGSVSGTDDLMAPPPSFRKKKRGARGAPAKTSTGGLPGTTHLMTPGVPNGASNGEPKSFSANETGEGAVPEVADTGAAVEPGVGAGGEEGVAGDDSEGKVVAPDPLSELGFAVFTPPVSTPTEDGGDADADGAIAGGVDDWLEFKPPEPVPDSDDEGSDDNGEGNLGGAVSGAGSDGVGVGPGMGTLSRPLPGMSSPTDGTAAASWMDGGEDTAGLSGGGDEWSGAGSGDGAPGVDDFTAGMAFSAPPGMNLGFLPETEDGQESTDNSPSEQEQPAPTAYWGGGSDSPRTAEPEPEPEPEPVPDTVSDFADKGESAAVDSDEENDAADDSALAAARAAQTARLAAQIARLKRAGESADGDASVAATSVRDRSAEQPPPVDQNADDDDEESEFDPCVKRCSMPPCLVTVGICGAQARTEFALLPLVLTQHTPGCWTDLAGTRKEGIGQVCGARRWWRCSCHLWVCLVVAVCLLVNFSLLQPDCAPSHLSEATPCRYRRIDRAHQKPLPTARKKPKPPPIVKIRLPVTPHSGCERLLGPLRICEVCAATHRRSRRAGCTALRGSCKKE
eukprot:COSAG02_NODE_920_length_15934_cov_11.363751_9_plen_621_part_00